MKYAEWRYSRIKIWNPSGCELLGTVRTLWLLTIDDCFEHIGKGIVVEC